MSFPLISIALFQPPSLLCSLLLYLCHRWWGGPGGAHQRTWECMCVQGCRCLCLQGWRPGCDASRWTAIWRVTHALRRGHEHISTLINIIKNIWDIKCGTINLVQACLPSHGKGSEICHSRTIIILWKLQVPCAMLPRAKRIKKASHFLTSTPQVVCKPPKSRTYLRGRKCSNLPYDIIKQHHTIQTHLIGPSIPQWLPNCCSWLVWLFDLMTCLVMLVCACPAKSVIQSA